jgi:glycosyltransferase involved in cell wall biosynthesis
MKKKIRILVIPSWYPPDGGYFFKEHSEALAEAGCSVDVLYNRIIGLRKLGKDGLKELQFFRERNENGLCVIRSSFFKIPGNEKINARRWISSTRRLFARYLSRSGAPDLILAHSAIWAGSAAGIIYRRYGVKYIIAEHRSFLVFSTEESKRQLTGFYRRILPPAYRHAGRIIAVSDSMRPGIREIAGDLDRRITVVPNMVNGDFFTFPDVERTADPFVFISVGRLVGFKGLDHLLRAFAGLRPTAGKEVRLRIIGRGEERASLERLAEELGISPQVEFTGRLSRAEVARAYREANCFVLPSLYEAFGVVLIEAMAAGLPVIATRSGGPESIVDQGSGYLAEPGSAEGLKHSMEQMIREYHSFDQAAIRRATLERYGHRKIAMEYLKIFQQLTGES